MIKVEQLCKRFPEQSHLAVDNVSFTIPSGKIGCLIGTSGSGKTTTLRLINRLIQPSSGKVEVNGIRSSELDAIPWRRKIGYVIQKAGLLPHLTVFDNISLLAKVLKRGDEEIENRVKELLDLVELDFDQFALRYPNELSGGQQQRVGVARALMEDPPLLLMDEPFGALDPITRKVLRKELKRLNTKLNKTILLVTHDLEEAFDLGDLILLMHEGKIVHQGDEESFTKAPDQSFVSEFVKGHLA